MKLKVGDIIGNKLALGRIQWIDTNRAGIECISLSEGYRPLLSSANVLIEDLEFIHRPLDKDDKQLKFPFYLQLLTKDDESQRGLMRDYQDEKLRLIGVSSYQKKEKSIEKKIEDMLKGKSVEEILKLLED